jgi:hypothetical protein
MRRIEEFVKYGKRYVYFDLSYFSSNEELHLLIELAKPVIEKYKKHSVYTIVNVEGIRFDTRTKELMAEWMRYNAPYVKHCIAVGMDGIKKIMLESLFAMSERRNVDTAATKEQAVEMLKQKEWEKWDKWGNLT